jgi:hypothetical protein
MNGDGGIWIFGAAGIEGEMSGSPISQALLDISGNAMPFEDHDGDSC